MTAVKKGQATRVEIKIRKLERGVTDKMIAEQVGVTPSQVAYVFHGRSRSKVVRSAIAKALGWPESRIWSTDASPSRKARVVEQVA